jgi:hypothetical protein
MGDNIHHLQVFPRHCAGKCAPQEKSPHESETSVALLTVIWTAAFKRIKVSMYSIRVVGTEIMLSDLQSRSIRDQFTMLPLSALVLD